MGKAKNYINYILRFAKSKDKKKVLQDLTREVKDKGVITGVQSLLHKRSHFYEGEFEEAEDIFEAQHLVIKEYDKHTKVTLPDNTHPLVSIIIPMYNQVDYTYNCICSVYENNDFKDYEIIVADDQSTEDTTIVRENFQNIVYLRNEPNLGFLRNCNHAATYARGKYIVFLNNDTQVQKDWLAELLYIFEQYPDTGLAGSKLLYPNGMLQEAGGIIWRDGRGHNYGHTGNPLKPEFNYVKEVDYISGASVMIPAELWKEAGGFDEYFLPAYCEDSDLSFRLREMGYKVRFTPFSMVVHFEGVTHGRDLDKGIKQYQVVNQAKFKERWAKQLQKKSKFWEHLYTERDRSGGKKHVLVIDHYLPQIEKDAGSRTITNFIDTMLALDYSVKFLGENSNTGKHYEKMFQLKGVEVLYGNQFNFAVRGWRKYLKKHMGQLDAILLSRSSVCLPIITFLRNNHYKGNIIYYGHDLGYLRLEKEAAAQKDSALKIQAKKIKDIEDYMYQQADNSLVCGYDELEYLKKYIKKPLHYVPPYFFDVAKDEPGFEQREGLFFVGGFNHPPNREAMQWFLDEVYAPLHEQGIKLTIAGSKMPDFIFEYKKKFRLLTVLPDVPVDELNDLYTHARIAIVPLTSGAGVKGKVIEAFAKGVPVAGTDVAFEGMPKGDAFLYKGQNSTRALTDEILKLYNDKDHWNRLAGFGKKYVLRNFSKENMREVFKKVIG